MNRGAHSGVSEHSSITERWSGQLSDAPAYLSAQQTTGNEKPNLKKHQIRLTAFYVPLPVLVGCIAAPTGYSADVSVSPPVSDSLHPGANCRDPSENRLGCYVICPELFGTVTLIPFLLEAAVRRREPENSSENWINDARRRLADWRGKSLKPKPDRFGRFGQRSRRPSVTDKALRASAGGWKRGRALWSRLTAFGRTFADAMRRRRLDAARPANISKNRRHQSRH
jgi:hypothetical protein